MPSRHLRKMRLKDRQVAERRYEKHRRRNVTSAVPGELNFIVVLDNLKASFNVGKIFRSADAFGACEVHLIGTTFFDPTPAMGSFKWVPAVFHETFDSCYAYLIQKGYQICVFEPESGEFLHEAKLPEKLAFVVGHEQFGISFDKDDYDLQALKIKQLGKVQSLNVSVAASIVMYEYSRQHG